MKKLTVIILAVVMMVTVTACSSEPKNPDVNDIMSKVRSEIEFPDMADIDIKDISLHYTIDKDQVEQMVCVLAGSGVTADEVLILKMKDGFKADEVKKSLETRKKLQSDLFEPYNPDEMPKINSAVTEISGNYVFFAITNDNSKAKKIFNEAL